MAKGSSRGCYEGSVEVLPREPNTPELRNAP